MVKKPRVYHYTCINNIYIFKEKKKKRKFFINTNTYEVLYIIVSI